MTAEATFSGTVQKGRFTPDATAPWLVWLGMHEGQRIVLTAATEKQRRSTQANRRYHGLIVPCVAEVLSAGRDIPLSHDQVHEVLKYAFLGHELTALGPLPKSSRNLSVQAFKEFCDKVEEWLATTWGVVMPERDEDR